MVTPFIPVRAFYLMTVSVKEQIMYHAIELELKKSDNFEKELIELPENS